MLERLRTLIKRKRYRVTLYTEQERDADEITIGEIELAYSDPDSEIIEDYPKDPRGSSALVLAFTKVGEPLHAVWSIHENTAFSSRSIDRIRSCGQTGGNEREDDHEVLPVL